MFVFNDMGKMWQEVVMKYFKVHLSEDTVKTTKTSVSIAGLQAEN